MPSALILYLNYFIHGIGCSILGQAVIKEALAASWGVEAMAITAISAALGLGRLIASRLMIFPPKLHFPTAGQASSYQLGNRKGIWPEITGRVSQILYLFPPF